MGDMSMASCVDEFRKIAEVQSRKGEVAKQVAKNVGQGALGYGLGYGAGHLLDKYVLPKFVGQGRLSPDRRRLLANALGALGGIGTMATRQAFSEAQHKVDDVRAGHHSSGV